jgi:sporulation protein YlmC with PRC-barrel domain
MDLVRDLLDQPVVDRNGRPMGRVDGIVLDLRADAPPRVVSIAIGPAVLGERLHRAIGRRD